MRRWHAAVCAGVALLVALFSSTAWTFSPQTTAGESAATEPGITNGSSAGTVVPRLVQFSGTVTDSSGKSATGAVTITFSLYELQEGGAPLWSETQSLTADEQGHYTAFLGAASPGGLPLDLFASGAARWLGIAPGLPGVGEQPRVLLVGVPYALKAADADTLGGLPPSAFVQSGGSSGGAGGSVAAGSGVAAGGKSATASSAAPSQQAKSKTAQPNSIANYLPYWNGIANIGNSAIYQSGSSIGIGTTTPHAGLDEFASTAGAHDPVAQFGSGGAGDSNSVKVYNGGGNTTLFVSGGPSNFMPGTSVNDGGIRILAGQKIFFGDSGLTRMVLDKSGNAGIGTTTPATRLDVLATTAGVHDPLARFGSAGATDANSLEVYNGGGEASLFVAGQSGQFMPGTSADDGGLRINEGQKIFLGDGGLSRMVLDKSGNVGIGTTTPAAKLEVNGTAKFDQAVTFKSGQTFPGAASLGSNNFVGTETITGNLAVASSSTISLGTTGGGLAIKPNPLSPNVIGGYSGNSVAAGLYGATIGGGGQVNQLNAVMANFATVGGGNSNTASGYYATVAGGNANTASQGSDTVGGGTANAAAGGAATVAGGDGNQASAPDATVAGGSGNLATGDGATVCGGNANSAAGGNSTIGGGDANIAGGFYAAVGGGSGNGADGYYATVPGGFENLAHGRFSFAAGQTTSATNDGTFVWGDDSSASFVTDTGANSFVARAAGGFTFYTAADLSTGVTLASGSGSWSSLSDRSAKANVANLSGKGVLSRLETLPIFTWNYKAQPSSVRHLGPMAQDFHTAFGLGEDEKHISTVDPEGVALAAIQELYRELKETEARSQKAEASSRQKDTRIARQAGEIRQLTTEVEKLESLEGRMSALQARLDQLEAGTRTRSVRSPRMAMVSLR